MLIGSATDPRRGHDNPRRQPIGPTAGAVTPSGPQPHLSAQQHLPQQQQQPQHQEYYRTRNSDLRQDNARRHGRITLVDHDSLGTATARDHETTHITPAPIRQQGMSLPPPSMSRVHKDDHGRRGGSSDIDYERGETDEDDEESYEEDLEGVDEYRYQYDYNGARSTVDAVDDNERVHRVRCAVPRPDAPATDSTDDEEDDDSQYDSDSQEDGSYSDGSDDDDDKGHDALVRLCRKWRTSRVRLETLAAASKVLRQERNELERRLINHMRERGIDDVDAFGTIERGRRVKVHIKQAPTTCSVSDKILRAAVFQHVSAEMAHMCAIDEAAKKAAREARKAKEASSSSSKKRGPYGDAPGLPQAKHPRRTSTGPSSPTASDRASYRPDGGLVEKSERIDRASSTDASSDSHDDDASGSNYDDDDDSYDDSGSDDDGGQVVQGVSLSEALGAALAQARRQAQREIATPRFIVEVFVYDHKDRAREHEPLMIDMSKGKARAQGQDAVKKGRRRRARLDTRDPSSPPKLSREATQWAARLHVVIENLAKIRAEASPLRAHMAALTVDLPSPTSSPSQLQSASHPATTTDGANADGGDTAIADTAAAARGGTSSKSTPTARAAAAEAKRLRHARYASLRDSVAAYLNAHGPRPDERGGLAVRFVESAGGRNTPGTTATYRIRTVERGRNGNITVGRYAAAATSAASTALSAVGLRPDRPASKAALDRAFGNAAVRAVLFDALKTSLADTREKCKATLTRNLVITKVPSGPSPSKRAP
ncbi:hypothetical protein pmac_cds_926 [Pandoravirus macleodensis]|uniref:Uncharacterized protein n=1 Tax=Pandoravirus macleodensis TaxID=2107707 RepID=A0A2U7UGK7_9VIRU|nr:hypothetical protein pmac_cds_926 [Pandoravirus macleodensis]AVK77614.1 hypothetical protein pmac_cds_926 [Pandoravirus macleodensis]